MKKITLALVTAATVTTGILATTPGAEARGRGWFQHWHPHRHFHVKNHGHHRMICNPYRLHHHQCWVAL